MHGQIVKYNQIILRLENQSTPLLKKATSITILLLYAYRKHVTPFYNVHPWLEAQKVCHVQDCHRL